MILGIHHVNEKVPEDQWLWWDLGFLARGAIMVAVGSVLIARGSTSRELHGA